MKVKFIVNDYNLIWNLLFRASISENIHKLKQKLWDTYKNEYNIAYNDKIKILKDAKNFIPDDDTIYNIVLEQKNYEKIKKQVEKYRLELMKLWDKNSKITKDLMNSIVRKEIPDYTFFVVNKELNMIDHSIKGSLTIGKPIDSKNPFSILYSITKTIIIDNLKKYEEHEKKFMKAIVELAVYNEYATKLNGISCYLSGDPELLSLKRWLYPYWLMYLGIPQEEFLSYIMRDKVSFDVDKYAYEKELKKMNIEEFIDFCIRNQKYIVRAPKETKEIL